MTSKGDRFNWVQGPALAVALLVFVLGGGTLGSVLIEGWHACDAFYMTMITTTTVGYRELHEMSWWGQAWTIGVLLTGVATLFYTASTLMAYIIYCTSPETIEKFGTSRLVLTTPFPIYGIFRYLYLVHQRGSGSPSEVLLTDRPLVACIALWGLAVVAIIYRPFGL